MFPCVELCRVEIVAVVVHSLLAIHYAVYIIVGGKWYANIVSSETVPIDFAKC